MTSFLREAGVGVEPTHRGFADQREIRRILITKCVLYSSGLALRVVKAYEVKMTKNAKNGLFGSKNWQDAEKPLRLAGQMSPWESGRQGKPFLRNWRVKFGVPEREFPFGIPPKSSSVQAHIVANEYLDDEMISL